MRASALERPELPEVKSIDDEVSDFRKELDEYDAPSVSDDHNNVDDFWAKTEQLRAISASNNGENIVAQSNIAEVEKPLSRMDRIRKKLGSIATGAKNIISEYSSRANTAVMLVNGRALENLNDYSAAKQERYKSLTPNQLRRRKIAKSVGVVAVVVAGTFVGKEVIAEAQTIVNGGRADFDSERAHGMLAGALGVGNPSDKTIDYPAAMIPGVDQGGTWNSSSAVAQNEIANTMNSNGNGYDNVVGYSQGTDPVLRTAQRVAAENGGSLPDNFDATMIGGPSLPVSGWNHDPMTQAMAPIFEGMGIDVNPGEAPAGTTYIGKPGDYWANSGGRNPVAQVGQMLGTAAGGTHGYSAAEINNPANIITDVNGVKVVHVRDDLSGFGHAARANNLAWSDAAERAVDNLAPEGIVGQAAPKENIPEGINALNDVIEESFGMPNAIPAIPSMPNPMDIAPAAPAGGVPPVMDQVQQVFEQFTQPAAPASNYTPPVMEQVQQVFEQIVPAAAPAPAPAPVALPPQLNDIFGQFMPR